MIGYDIDGVLTSKPLPSVKKWGKMNGVERRAHKLGLLKQYKAAEPLLIPNEPFIAISARKDEPTVRAITTDWLIERYGDLVLKVFLLPTSRSIENVVNFKNAVIVGNNITVFTEDNKKVLKGLAQASCPASLYFWEEGMDLPIPFPEIK
jgi:hypothetical protein